MTTLKTSALGALALSFSVCAMADVNVPIDPVAHCLDTTSMTGGKTSFDLPPGRYLAWLENDSMYCKSFDTGRNCHIDTVVVSAPNASNKASPPRWGQAIRETSSTVEIPGAVPVAVSAFVLDSFCADNIGAATLHFQLQPF
jgi:hypothetical protein